MRPAAASLATLLLALGVGGAEAASGCTQSRDYILQGMAGALTKPARFYQDLFRVCQQTLELPNVKDAYVLKAGLIAIEPRQNTMMAAATTLTQFCRRFPRGTARVFTSGEQHQAKTIGLTVMMPALSAKSCQTMRGGV